MAELCFLVIRFFVSCIRFIFIVFSSFDLWIFPCCQYLSESCFPSTDNMTMRTIIKRLHLYLTAFGAPVIHSLHLVSSAAFLGVTGMLWWWCEFTNDPPHYADEQGDCSKPGCSRTLCHPSSPSRWARFPQQSGMHKMWFSAMMNNCYVLIWD